MAQESLGPVTRSALPLCSHHDLGLGHPPPPKDCRSLEGRVSTLWLPYPPPPIFHSRLQNNDEADQDDGSHHFGSTSCCKRGVQYVFPQTLTETLKGICFMTVLETENKQWRVSSVIQSLTASKGQRELE